MSGPDVYFEASDDKEMVTAIIEGDLPAVRRLLRTGRTMAAKSGTNGLTFVSIAILAQQKEVFVELLASNGLDPREERSAGASLYTATMTEDTYWISEIVKAGGELNLQGGGDLLIVKAMHSGISGRVDFFLERGADLEAKSNLGGTLLLESARVRKFDVSNMLLDRGAFAWVVDSLGCSLGYLAEKPMLIPAWDTNSDMERQRKILLHKLELIGFPQPAPSPAETIELVRRRNWPPLQR